MSFHIITTTPKKYFSIVIPVLSHYQHLWDFFQTSSKISCISLNFSYPWVIQSIPFGQYKKRENAKNSNYFIHCLKLTSVQTSRNEYASSEHTEIFLLQMKKTNILRNIINGVVSRYYSYGLQLIFLIFEKNLMRAFGFKIVPINPLKIIILRLSCSSVNRIRYQFC